MALNSSLVLNFQPKFKPGIQHNLANNKQIDELVFSNWLFCSSIFIKKCAL